MKYNVCFGLGFWRINVYINKWKMYYIFRIKKVLFIKIVIYNNVYERKK